MNQKPKFVFFGSPRFAAIVLQGLIEAGFAPAALVANPDRPVGRKRIITAPKTKQLVLDKELSETKIFQPERLDDHFIKDLKTLAPDFFVVAAYAKIIPDAVLKIARLGTLGTHPSLLPKYRGASPIQSVLLHGEHEAGTTIYLMDAKMDHGAILAQKKTPLDPLAENYLSLEERLATLSAGLLAEVIPSLMDKTLKPQTQDESAATFTKKFTTEDGFVSIEEIVAAQNGDTTKAKTIIQKINAFTPEPGAWTTASNGKRVKLLAAKIENAALRLTQIQEEGKKPQPGTLLI